MKLRDRVSKADILGVDLRHTGLGRGNPFLQSRTTLRCAGFGLPGGIMQPKCQRLEPADTGPQPRAFARVAGRASGEGVFDDRIGHGVSLPCDAA